MSDDAPTYKVIEASEALNKGRGTRKSPAQAIKESLPEGSMYYKDVAERYGVHIETMRRLCKSYTRDGVKRVNAPSQAVEQGGMLIYVFTPKDIEELDAYFTKRGKSISQ